MDEASDGLKTDCNSPAAKRQGREFGGVAAEDEEEEETVSETLESKITGLGEHGSLYSRLYYYGKDKARFGLAKEAGPRLGEASLRMEDGGTELR